MIYIRFDLNLSATRRMRRSPGGMEEEDEGITRRSQARIDEEDEERITLKLYYFFKNEAFSRSLKLPFFVSQLTMLSG